MSVITPSIVINIELIIIYGSLMFRTLILENPLRCDLCPDIVPGEYNSSPIILSQYIIQLILNS